MGNQARFSILAAVASHLCEDQATIRECRYQPTRTPCPIYATEAGYFTATRRLSSKPRPHSSVLFGTWHWESVPTFGYVNGMGWAIWRAKDDEVQP